MTSPNPSQRRTAVLLINLGTPDSANPRDVRRYLADLGSNDADDLYEVVLREVEAPLFAEVMRHCEGNQTRAAAALGINRATLRKKLRQYELG